MNRTAPFHQDDLNNWHLCDLLDCSAERYGDRPFIVGPPALTYREVALKTRQIASWLRQAGVKRGDRVMIITVNRTEVLLTLFAVARVGGIFTVINSGIKPYGLKQIMDQVNPVVVMLDEETAELAATVRGPLILWAGNQLPFHHGVKLDDLLRTSLPDQQKLPHSSCDPVCLIFTSGSTGAPRGVVICHDNIRFLVAAIQDRLGYRKDDVIGLFLPLSFDYGLYQVFLTAAIGARIFIGPCQHVSLELISNVRSFKITVLPLVPHLLAGMLMLLSKHPQPLPWLRCITSTGDQLPRSNIEKLRKLFPNLQVFPMYGLTECKRVSILLPEELDAKPESVGRPLEGVEVYVVGENGQPLPSGAIGELVVRGFNVARGYWKAPEETAKRFRQKTPNRPWELFTGDLCRLDRDGFIYFIGRQDNQIKHQGFRLNPLEIESVVQRIKGVSETKLVQTHNPEQLHLFVSVVNSDITPQKVIKFLQKRLEQFKMPEKIWILTELPVTPHGKLDQEPLKALVASH